MKRAFAITLLTIWALAGSFVGWKFWRELRATETRLTAVQAEMQAAKQGQARIAARLRDTQPDFEAAKRAPARNANANPAGQVAEVLRDYEGQPEYFRRVVEDPEINALFVAREKNILRHKYEFLLKKLHLTREEEESFLAGLAEKRVTSMDLANVARANGLAPNDAAILKGFAQANADTDVAIRALLGDARFAEFQEFDKNLPQWNATYSISVQLALEGAPLDGDQADAVRKILFARSSTPKPPANGSRPEIEAYLAKDEADAREMLAQAGTVLTPAQIAALKNTFDQSRISLKLRLLLQPPPDNP